MRVFKLFIIGLFVSMACAHAQTGRDSKTKYGIGEDSIRCVTNLSLYNEDFKNKNYETAFPAWEIVFNECPAATVNIYIDGIVMLKDKIAKNRDAAKFEELYQYLMKVHDQRIQFFGDHPRNPAAAIKGAKAIDMLNYKRDNAAIVEEAYQLLKESVTGLKQASQPAYLATYMSTAVNMYEMGKINAETVIDIYSTLSEYLDANLKDKAKSAAQLEIYDQVKGGVEALFAKSGVATCDVIVKIYQPQLEDNKFDLAWLKRVSHMLVRASCDDALLYKVSEYQHNIEPSSASAYGLARMYLKADDVTKALKFLNEAVELSDDNKQKADYMYQIGMIHLSNERFVQARSFALRAIEARPEWGMPYMLIGQAYALSANSIGSTEVEKKSAYWAAVDKFMKAKSVDPSITDAANEAIRTYSAHFPPINEVFFENLEEGQTYEVGGWINERTTVRARK